MRDNDEIDTKTVLISSKRYCVYCGKESNKIEGIEDYEWYYVHYCDCEGAKFEIEVKAMQEKMNSLEKGTNPILNRLRYNEELDQLKRKYYIL